MKADDVDVIGRSQDETTVTLFGNSKTRLAQYITAAQTESVAFRYNVILLLSGSPKCNDWQVLAPGMELDIKFHDGTGLATNQSVRSGTRGPAWPPVAWFEPWSTIGGESSLVDLVGRAAP